MNRFNSNALSSIDDSNEETEISNVFASQYNALYNSVLFDVNKMNVLNAELDNHIVKLCKSCACENSHIISEAQRLKANKTDGESGDNSCHL